MLGLAGFLADALPLPALSGFTAPTGPSCGWPILRRYPITLSNAFLFFAYSGTCFFCWLRIPALQFNLIRPVDQIVDNSLRIDSVLEHLFYSRDVSSVAKIANESAIALPAISVKRFLPVPGAACMVMVLEGLILSERATADRTGILLLGSLCIMLLQSLIVLLFQTFFFRLFGGSQFTQFCHTELFQPSCGLTHGKLVESLSTP